MINNGITPVLTANYLLELASVPLQAAVILRELTPPKHFDKAEFSNYIPEHFSQENALKIIAKFIADHQESGDKGKGFFKKFWSSKSEGKGLYLDGGFGVGKTHLLASGFHSYPGTKAYLSFQELMFLVGLQSLNGVAESFKNFKLLVIDEFEIDDPANTRITTNLLGQLFKSGVSILTSSNTPPGALGEGKFSVDDFQRELGALTKNFQIVKIDGEDYRTIHHLDESAASTWVASDTDLEIFLELQNFESKIIIDSTFNEFLVALSKVHPMRIRKALGEIDAVILRDIKQISHPHEALRFVYFIDKAYDNNMLLFVSSSVEINDIFHKSYFAGGDTKKYLRTMSRLREMTRLTRHSEWSTFTALSVNSAQ